MLKNLINSSSSDYYPKPKIIYAYDTLCGWCYGFSSEIEKTISKLAGTVDFELFNGGLFAGVKGPKMGYINAHIRRNMNKVTQRTGKHFGHQFENLLDNIHYPYNSSKASIAIEVVKELAPHKVLAFASDIQTSFFEFGKDIHNDDFYCQLSLKHGFDSRQFVTDLNSKYFENKTNAAFQKTNAIGFKGYPAIAIQFDNQFKIINEGFTTADHLIPLIQQELQLHLTLSSLI